MNQKNLSEKIVLDTNILLSALLKDGLIRKLLFTIEKEYFIPEHTLVEIKKYSLELSQRMKINETQFLDIFYNICKSIPLNEISEETYFHKKEIALLLCPKGHENDWPFFALCLTHSIPLWTNDKALHLQKEIKIITTQEMIVLLQEKKNNPKNSFL